MSQVNPTVSIGLPVYNGETYLGGALDALLAQDFTDFELIVSDNASTDRSAQICGDYARRDPRIRLVRNSSNIGAPANFNRTFALAAGRYFMWAADDDTWHRGYVRACVDALDNAPDAVLACSSLRFIDGSGSEIDLDYRVYDNPDLSSPSVRNRVHRYLQQGGFYQSYGLIRSDALRRTSMFHNVYGPDIVLMLELALQGPFVNVPKIMFWYRQPEGRTAETQAARQGLKIGPGGLMFPSLQLQDNLGRAIRRASLPWSTRQALMADLLWTTYWADPLWQFRLRAELSARFHEAVADRDPWPVVKYSFLAGSERVRDSIARIMRVVRRARRALSWL